MSYFIVAVATVSALGLHAWLYWRIRRWMDRDLALSFAGEDVDKRKYMLECLDRAKQGKIRRSELAQWLEQKSRHYAGPSLMAEKV
ncbi:MAG: hypothetical protein LBV45_01840 [Xanthomonadaceae bacterium]|jgi:acyl-CoA synthetase (AMP-forming)/AMP-acid ligase II|nr:hypothetical protein [Xanthomonadaceae bacterium]